MLFLPGMEAPKVERFPMPDFDTCLTNVAAAGEMLKKHEGDQFKYLVACEVIGNKADPA